MSNPKPDRREAVLHIYLKPPIDLRHPVDPDRCNFQLLIPGWKKNIGLKFPQRVATSENDRVPIYSLWPEWGPCKGAIGKMDLSKSKAETLKRALECAYIEPWIKSCIFKCIFLLNSLFLLFFVLLLLWEGWSGVSDGRNQNPANVTDVDNSTRQRFFCPHIFSLCS